MATAWLINYTANFEEGWEREEVGNVYMRIEGAKGGEFFM